MSGSSPIFGRLASTQSHTQAPYAEQPQAGLLDRGLPCSRIEPSQSTRTLFGGKPCLGVYFLVAALTSGALLVPVQLTFAQEGGSAKHSSAKYMGVASCSSSNCHGAVAPRESANILQNEYTTWSKHDAHAKAWLSLVNEDSKKIGAHLGIDAPEQDPWCLSCHATQLHSPADADEKFRLEDGVGCESCHGAAEHYIGPHTERGATRARNLELGMTNIVAPAARGTFCLTCHLGTDDKTVNHKLIGAGHPRLTFELDTFSALEPAHWDVDDDYRSRKEDYSPARAWLVGQVVRAQAQLDAMLSAKRSRAGDGLLAGPELTLLNCYTCHHSLTEEQWKDRDYAGRPGELRLNLSSLIISHQALLVVDPVIGASLGTAVTKLHESSEPKSVAQSLQSALGSARTRVEKLDYDRALVQRLAKALTSYGATSESPAFEVAEQIAMGISSLVAALSADGSLHKREVDQIYSALSEPASFKPGLFTAACQQLLAKF